MALDDFEFDFPVDDEIGAELRGARVAWKLREPSRDNVHAYTCWVFDEPNRLKIAARQAIRKKFGRAKKGQSYTLGLSLGPEMVTSPRETGA